MTPSPTESEDRATLLTCDGKGREAKVAALDRLLTTERVKAEALATQLQAIIDGCYDPATARRRILLDLTPIRATLRRYREGQEPETS